MITLTDLIGMVRDYPNNPYTDATLVQLTDDDLINADCNKISE